VKKEDGDKGAFEHALCKMRDAFFLDGLDIARQHVQLEIGRQAGVDNELALRFIADGRAHASLSADYEDAQTLGVKGSPTMILNEGRQKLYRNVGYRIIEANIQDLMREPNPDQASWC
jgi:predicted DsbA family dithiol-disulfide isomerase